MSKIIHFENCLNREEIYSSDSDSVSGCIEIVSSGGRKKIYSENNGRKLILEEAPQIFLNQIRLRDGGFNPQSFLNYFESKGYKICRSSLEKKADYSAKIDLVNKVVEGDFPSKESLSMDSKIKMNSIRKMGYRVERKERLEYFEKDKFKY